MRVEGRFGGLERVQLLRMRDRKRREEDSVEKLEDAEIRADAESECEDDGEGEAGRAEELASGVANVGQEIG